MRQDRFGCLFPAADMLLARFVDIGTELVAISATCTRAQGLDNEEARNLAHYFCELSRLKIEALFHDVRDNRDAQGYRLAQQVLKGEYDWLEDGICSREP